ncbi:MAG: STAS domain-containing protein [Deltaproteobacteria bacterium]|nr:STAS domain-containing protein [Deltaproteobacteria bacterium]
MAHDVIEMKPSKIGLATVGSTMVLSPTESLTHKNCEEFEAMFNECIEKHGAEIILDCKAVPFLDSEALELLVRMNDEARGRGGALKIIGINSVCREIFLATRLINVFHLYKDVHDAIKSEL